jgi:hypothetical protein
VTATITLDPEYAALVAAGVKTIETRPGPSYGKGKVPGLSVRPGERLLIHAGMRRPGCLVCSHGLGMHNELGYCRYGTSNRESRHPKWAERGGECGCDCPNYPHGVMKHLHPGHIVASTIVLDCVPITGCADKTHHICERAGRLTEHWPLRPDPYGEEVTERDITDQLPLGDFTPGRWAWLLDDVKPTTERCPACWGGGWLDRGMGWQTYPCLACSRHGTCLPIPAKGRQGIWRWEP